MAFSFFKRRDPICGMKEEKGKGIEKDGSWFCSGACARKHEQAVRKSKGKEIGGCCHH